MTIKRDLKRRVRDRQAETGESYVTALRHVRAAAPVREPFEAPSMPSISYLEMIDLSEVGAALGMKCQISMYPDLLPQLEPGAMLRQLRAALAQPQLATMRAVMHGEDVPGGVDPVEIRSLHRRLTEQRAGATPGGTCLALEVDGRHGPVLVAVLVMAPLRMWRKTLPIRLMILPSVDWRGLWIP